jgi:hypothetical protein
VARNSSCFGINAVKIAYWLQHEWGRTPREMTCFSTISLRVRERNIIKAVKISRNAWNSNLFQQLTAGAFRKKREPWELQNVVAST